jgi:translocation and assembly module TamB
VSGVLAGDVTVRGTFRSPVVEGVLDLDDGEFRVVETGVRYRDVAGSFRLEGETLVVDSLVARAGGPIRITGELDVSSSAEPGFDLVVTAERALVLDDGDNRLAVFADLEVQGPFEEIRVTGEARTHRSVLYVPEGRPEEVVDLEDPALMERVAPELVAERDRLFPEVPFLENLVVDIALHVSPDTWVRATDLNVEVFTDPEIGPLSVRVDRGLRRIVVQGVLRSERGEYSFMSRRFEITRGTAQFLGGREIDPLLQVVAEHEVRMAGREALEIRIVLGGTLMDPIVSFESNAEPPLAQSDLLAFIAFGRSAASLMQQQGSALSGQAAGAGDLVGNVAGLASRQLGAVAADVLLDEFESEMARELGLDMLHIAPADLPAELFTGRFEDLRRGTQIEAGRYIGPRRAARGPARPPPAAPPRAAGGAPPHGGGGPPPARGAPGGPPPPAAGPPASPLAAAGPPAHASPSPARRRIAACDDGSPRCW